MEEQSKFEDWAIVEVMGHQTYAGFVTTQAFGQAVLFRIDVPELPERERVLRFDEYTDHALIRAGSTVKELPVQGYTKLIGAGSIYAITPCTEEAARKSIDKLILRKLSLVSVPPVAAIAAPDADEYVDVGDSDDEADDDPNGDDGEF
jgi:hypothetical protein